MNVPGQEHLRRELALIAEDVPRLFRMTAAQLEERTALRRKIAEWQAGTLRRAA